METYKIVLIAIAAAIGALLLFMILRTMCIRPKKMPKHGDYPKLDLDKEGVKC